MSRSTGMVVTAVLLYVTLCPSQSSAANILLLPSTAYSDTLQASLRTALTTDGHTVTVAPVDELAWDGTNPPTSGFDVIVHLAGSTNRQMTSGAATALLAFIDGGGGYFTNAASAVRAWQLPGSPSLTPTVALVFNATSPPSTDRARSQLWPFHGHPAWTGLPMPTSVRSDLHYSGFTPNVAFMTNSGGSTTYCYAAREAGNGRIVTAGLIPTLYDSPSMLALFVRNVNWLARITNGVTATDQVIDVDEDQTIVVHLAGTDIRGLPVVAAAGPAVVALPNQVIVGNSPAFSFTAGRNFDGIVVQPFAVGNEFGSDEGTVTLRVRNLERPPVAPNRTFTTNEDTSVYAPFVFSDPDGGPLTFALVSGPNNGILQDRHDSARYVPNPNWHGTEVVRYRVTDPTGLWAEGTHTITVTPVPDPPVGANTTFTTRRNTAIATPLIATDPDGTSPTYQVLTNPPQGTLSGTAPNLTYTPPTNYTGTVGFTWRATDGVLNSPTYTVTINVLPPTTITATPQSVTLDEDVATPILLTATDTQARALSYELVTPPAAGTGSLQGTPPEVTYVPPANWSGAATFRFRACVGTDCSDPATVSLTVRAVNDAPTLSDLSLTTSEETAVTQAVTGADVEGSALTYSVHTPPARGTAVFSGNSLTYTPALDVHGTDTFTIRAFDGALYSAPATVTVTITNVNDAPVATSRSVVAYANVDTAVTLTATDVDDEPATLSYEVTGPPAHGTLSGTPPVMSYRPTGSYTGLDTITFVARDPQGAASAPGTITLQVGGGGQAPVAHAQSVSFDEDTERAITLAGTDPEGAPLGFEIVAPPAQGTLTGTPPNIRYRPRLNYFGVDQFTFRVSDGVTWSAPATVLLTIRGVNDAPMIVSPGRVTVTEDEPRQFTVTILDVDSPAPYALIQRRPVNGTVVAADASGLTFTYTPNPDFFGTDSLTLRPFDGALQGPEFTVNLQVANVPDPPVALAQQRTTEEDLPLALMLESTDVDRDPLTFAINNPPAHGTLTGTPPNVQYIPARDYHGPDSFTFTAHDGRFESPAATVSLTVTPVNDAPVIQPATLSTAEDTPLLVVRGPSGIVASDVDGDALTLRFETPSAGTMRTIGLGQYEYAPPPDFHGTATIVMRANDGRLDSAPATLTIQVTPVNDAPVFIEPLPAATRTVKDGETVRFTLAARDVDGDPLRYIADPLPAGATLGATTGAFAWTPGYEQVGEHVLTFRVVDRVEAFTELVVTIVVTAGDTDGDGVPDAVERRWSLKPDDPDSDGDGLDDFTELGDFDAPYDTDRDTIFDALDFDSDNDGHLDTDERGPDGQQVDTDRDGTPDQRDRDSDADAIDDLTDNCRIVANAGQEDLDGDGIGDVCDDDRDGDGFSNAAEIGWNSNPDALDTDGDTIADTHELAPDGVDTDRDGLIDARDLDSDGDGLPDAVEAGDDDVNTPPVDSDNDGISNYRDHDSDNDGIHDRDDKCPLVSSPNNEDLDGDGQGDICDGDEDGDGVPDVADVCPRVPDPPQSDADGDGVGDACSADDDGDGVLDGVDNCPQQSNADQRDSDRDGLGDVCDDGDDSAMGGGCAGAGGVGWWMLAVVIARRRRSAGWGRVRGIATRTAPAVAPTSIPPTRNASVPARFGSERDRETRPQRRTPGGAASRATDSWLRGVRTPESTALAAAGRCRGAGAYRGTRT